MTDNRTAGGPPYTPIATWDFWWPIMLRMAGTVFLMGVVTVGMLWNTLFAQMPTLPSKDSLWEMNRIPSIEFVDMKGATIAVRGPHYGRAVKLSELPPHVVNAFIAAEDKRFLTHKGVDAMAILRATLSNARA